METKATESFNERYNEAFKKMEVIKGKLENFKKQQQENPNDWGYVGSIGYVNSVLSEIVNSLNNF